MYIVNVLHEQCGFYHEVKFVGRVFVSEPAR